MIMGVNKAVILVLFYLNFMYICGTTVNQSPCRNVTYHVQHLHQSTTRFNNGSAMDDLKTYIANLQKDVQSLQEEHHKKDAELSIVKAQLRNLIQNGISCPTGYTTQFRGTCYQLNATVTSWATADRRCKEKNAALLVIETAQEDEYLRNFIKTNIRNDPVWGYWMAGTDVQQEGVWKWTTNGQSVTYTAWGPREPNGGRIENCLHFNKLTGYKWNDVNCDVTTNVGAICEKHMIPN